MKARKIFILGAVFMLVLASLACQAAQGDSPAPTSPAKVEPTKVAEAPSAEPTEEAPAPSILPAPVASAGAGMACLGFREGGFSCLNENGWQNFNTENSDLPSNYLTAGALCPDGRLAIAHYEGVSLFDGKKFEHIAKSDGYSTAEGLACAADGSLWVAHFKGVSHYANGAWKTYGSELLAAGESANELVYHLALAPDGKLWAVTSRSVALFENDQWTIFQKGQGFENDVFFRTLTLDATGRPWVGLSSGAAVYDNGSWQMVNKAGYASPEAIGLDARGQLWVGTLSKGVSVFDGKTWENYTHEAGNLSSNKIGALTADSQGRGWVGTSYGLSVFDGENWQTYRMDNADLADNSLKFIVVAKDGPVIPALVEKDKASLTGKLEDASHKPLSGKRVEICVEPLGTKFSGETPCSDQPFNLSSQTDDQGVFVFEAVPAGYYVIVAEPGNGWAQLPDQFGIGSARTLIKAGENHDIGTLTLKKE